MLTPGWARCFEKLPTPISSLATGAGSTRSPSGSRAPRTVRVGRDSAAGEAAGRSRRLGSDIAELSAIVMELEGLATS